jgi:hypothetical protein
MFCLIKPIKEQTLRVNLKSIDLVMIMYHSNSEDLRLITLYKQLMMPCYPTYQFGDHHRMSNCEMTDEFIAEEDSENIAEVQIFIIRHVQESLLHLNLFHTAGLRVGYF